MTKLLPEQMLPNVEITTKAWLQQLCFEKAAPEIIPDFQPSMLEKDLSGQYGNQTTKLLFITWIRAQAALACPEVPVDKGPWQLDTRIKDGYLQAVLQSHDFKHDVALLITGDFADDNDRLRYGKGMCQWLNRAVGASTPQSL